MARISPELEVWLVADPEMCGSWRRLARAVQLQSCVPRLEVTTRRRLRTDSDKLGEVLRLWRQCHPHTYTVHTLLAVLDTMVAERFLSYNSPLNGLSAGHEEYVRVGGADDEGEAGRGGGGDLRDALQHAAPLPRRHAPQPRPLPRPPRRPGQPRPLAVPHPVPVAASVRDQRGPRLQPQPVLGHGLQLGLAAAAGCGRRVQHALPAAAWGRGSCAAQLRLPAAAAVPAAAQLPPRHRGPRHHPRHGDTQPRSGNTLQGAVPPV